MSHLKSHIGKRLAAWLGAACVICAAACAAPAPGAPDAPGALEVLQAELPERKLPGLETILRKALVNGPSVIMREWEAAAAREEERGGRAPMLPTVSAWAAGGVIYEQHREAGGYDRTITALLYNVRFYQPLYHWGALEKNYRITQLRGAIARRNIAETRRALAVDLRRRYFDVVLAANALRLAHDNLRRLGQDLAFAKQAVADGTLAQAALDAPQRNIDNALPELARLENAHAALRLSLAQIAGVPEQDIDELTVAIPAPGGIGAALRHMAANIAAPPGARIEDLRDAASIEKLNYEINKKRLYPKLGADLSVNQENRTPDNNILGQKSLITSWNALVSVNWTLFDGFAARSAQRASLSRLRALETNRTLAEQQQDAALRSEAAHMLIQWEQLQNTERDLARAEKAAALSEQDFAAGTGSRQAVADARAALANTQQGAYAARAAFYTTLAACLSNRGCDPILNGAGDSDKSGGVQSE